MRSLNHCVALLLLALPITLGASPTTRLKPTELDPAAVRRHGPAYRYPQDGWIVLHIEGEPYERGYQHGRLLASEIRDYIQTLARYRAPKSPSDGWRELRNLANALFLRRYDKEYLEEMKGIADGAAAGGAHVDGRPVDFLDVVAINSEIESTFVDEALDATATGLEGRVFREPPETTRRTEPESHCSAFVATGPATADGKVVIGHITMWNLFHAQHFNVWVDINPSKGHRVLMQTFPGGIMSGMDYYMNDSGLIVCETTLHQTAFDIDGTPLCSRIRRAVQYADSIDDAVAILSNQNNGLYSNEWLMADTRTNEIAMFELGTHTSRLWRSSKNQWYGGTEGFYWGCNNAKDLQVRLETVPGPQGKPANVVFRPHDRDRAWLALFDKHKGKINAEFGMEAFTTPPLSAFPSLDAKVTTTDLARSLTTIAVFGPPLGRVWEPTPSERERYPEIRSLVPNDWTLLRAEPPSSSPVETKAVDLRGPSSTASAPAIAAAHTPAWHGTILPESDADIWLAAAFADCERLVSLENALRHKSKEERLSRADRDRLAVAHFGPCSRYLAARARLGRDLALSEIQPDLRRDEWYDIAAGKGVLILAELRRLIGSSKFDLFMDGFGRDHAGKPVSAREFFDAAEKVLGRSLKTERDAWLGQDALPRLGEQPFARWTSGRFWSVDAFEHEPDQALIVYGTLKQEDAQREAATRLQDQIRRRWSNITVPIRSDAELTDEERSTRHLLLIGRPDSNSVVARLASSLPVVFGSGSFVLQGKTYAHPASAVVAGSRAGRQWSRKAGRSRHHRSAIPVDWARKPRGSLSAVSWNEARRPPKSS